MECDFCGKKTEEIVEPARCAFCEKEGCNIHFAFSIKVKKLNGIIEESKEILICRECAQGWSKGG